MDNCWFLRIGDRGVSPLLVVSSHGGLCTSFRNLSNLCIVALSDISIPLFVPLLQNRERL